ncbi:Transmembrane protein 214 [Trinorchestia longiramus]|nr:Transmembrane protein 214 [Trinorchestia longiramus]
MASGEWEVVGASKKKANGAAKSGKQLDASAEVKKGNKQAAQRVYDPKAIEKFKLIDKMADDDEMLFKDSTVSAPKSSKSANKKSAPSKPKTLKDAVSKLNLSELQGLCKTLQSQFNSDPLVWLKDLASFLNLRLNPSIPVDSVYRNEQSSGAPLDYVSLPIREFLVRMVQGCSVPVLAQFHRHCFTSMLHEAMRGLSVHGFALFIQVIGNVCREACVTHAPDYINLREMYETHPRPGLTYVWLMSSTISTAARAKLYRPAVSMWTEGLLPLVTAKQYSALAAQCGKDLARSLDGYQPHVSSTAATGKKGKPSSTEDTRRSSKSQAVVTSGQLIALLDVAYAPSTQIPRNINKILIDVFARFKIVCCNGIESSTVFQQLLPRLVPSCSPALAQQVASVCELCLSSDSGCWDVWLSMLPRHFMQSAKLFKLVGGESRYSSVFSSTRAQAVLQNFEQLSAARLQDNPQARELNREVKKVQSGVASAVSRKKDQQSAERSSGLLRVVCSVVRTVFWVALVVGVVGYTSVCLHAHHANFQSTLLGKMATKFGVSEQVKQGVRVLAEYSTSAYAWGVRGYSDASQVLTPWLVAARERTDALLNALETRFPAVVTSVSGAAAGVQRAALALYHRAFPYACHLYDSFATVLHSDGVTQIVDSVGNATARLSSFLFPENSTRSSV